MNHVCYPFQCSRNVLNRAEAAVQHGNRFGLAVEPDQGRSVLVLADSPQCRLGRSLPRPGQVRARIGVVNVDRVSANRAARAAMAAVGVGWPTAAMLTIAPRQAACSIR